jgi:hypothetical protein
MPKKSNKMTMVQKKRFGSTIGSILGGLGSAFLPIPGVDGSQLGGMLGNLLPFKRGTAAVKKRKRGGK